MSERKILILENLPLGISSSELTDLLSPLGTVSWTYIKTPEDGRLNHTGYAEMATEKEATKVIVKWNGMEIKNHVLRVRHVPSDFDRATMGDAWRNAKPPSSGKGNTGKLKELEKNDTDRLMATSSLTRDSENKTVQYNRKDLIEFKPSLDKNSDYDEYGELEPIPKTKPSSKKPFSVLSAPDESKEKLISFNMLMVMLVILAIIGIGITVYFFLSKM